jgi:phosphinothricin acetyltransferase
MTIPITIRPAGESDLADILRIYNQAIEKTTAVFEYRPHTLEMRRDWFRVKQAASLPILVAVESGPVLGFASYGPFRAWPAYKYSVELSVYVDELARGRGIGSTLVRSILASAREQDLHVVMAGITSDNTISLRLHEKLGFVEVGHIPEVGYKFGRRLDLKLLQIVLDGPRHPTDS